MVKFWLCFLPLFVAVDAIGTLPLFMHLTHGLDGRDRRRVVVQSVLTAAAVAVLFLLVGKLVLSFLGVSVPDFLIAGGILLFAISLSDMLAAEKRRRKVSLETIGAVPLGVPLIAGPAVLTTQLVLLDQHGPLPTVLATVINIALAGMVFALAGPINRVLGRAGSKTLSKLASLLLAAIAVNMIRRGLTAAFFTPEMLGLGGL